MRWRYGIVGLSMLLCHCGGGTDGASPMGQASTSAGTIIQLVTLKSASLHPLAEVVEYVVMVEGPDMATWTTHIDAAAATAPIAGIPAGEHRHIHIEARNNRDDIIQRGDATDVVIPAEQVTTVAISMVMVPIFTNLREGSAELNTRLRPEILATPGHSVQLREGTTAEPTTVLTDLALGSDTIPIPDAGVTALHLAPLAPGRYHFAVEDLDTHDITTIAVDLLDGSVVRGAPLVSAAAVQSTHQFWNLGGME